ncbi:ubiquitin carboxyl-terminal hydrolase 50 isoform X2 [Muntiacus reevesi]
MNAILQCLCSISPLVEYFLSGKYINSLQKDCSEVATAFACVMTDMWLGDSDCVSPEIFRSALGNLYPVFMKKTQQDAQEFLIYVLNELHEALKKYHWRKSYEKKSISRCCRKMIASESSIITQLFEGQLSYSIICLKCENCTYKNEVFTIISLPIPSEYECSLQDCLQCFFQQDTLTWNNQIHCSFCETKQETAVRATISKAPKTIVFHLKRFDILGTMKRKLRTNIHYPLTNLDLTPYICPIFRKHPKYNLCAVVKIVSKWLSNKEDSACNSGGLQEILSLCQEDLLEKEMAIPPVFLSRKSHGHRSLVGCSSWGCKRLDTTEGLNNTIEFSLLPLFILNTVVYLFCYLKEPAYGFVDYLCSISLTSKVFISHLQLPLISIKLLFRGAFQKFQT